MRGGYRRRPPSDRPRRRRRRRSGHHHAYREAFQTFGCVPHILLDRTGTLTEGKPSLVAPIPAAGTSEPELLATAAAAESSSQHPLGQAIVAAAFDRDVSLPPVTDFTSVTGLGIRAEVAGRPVLIGRPGYFTDAGVALDHLVSDIERLEAAGHTVVVVSREQRVLGAIAIGDELRADAAQAIAGIRGAGLTPVLVTGDNPRAAAVLAAQLGIEQVHGGMLPDGKAILVRDLQAQGAK